MKLPFALFAVIVACPALASAQVKVNQAALLQLAGVSIPALVVNKPEAPLRAANHHRVIHHHRITVAVAKPVLMPVVARVAPPPQPPPIAKPVAPSPAVLKFDVGSADLPANSAAVFTPFCKSKTVIGIEARAPENTSDPSIAMRLSLSRAMAMRDALVACGVPSANIIPRAVGDVPGQNENEAVLGEAGK